MTLTRLNKVCDITVSRLNTTRLQAFQTIHRDANQII